MGGLTLAAAVYSAVSLRIKIKKMSIIGQSIIHHIRTDIFTHLQKLPFSYYDDRPHGKIQVRVVNYVNSLSDLLSNGIVNTICSNIGLTAFLENIGLVTKGLGYIPFLTEKTWAKFTIIFINFWVGVPYLLLMATGVLMNIPADLYEAATLDGANAFQQFKNITMPYMLFVTGPYLVNSVVQNVNNFNVIYLTTQDVYTTLDQKLANSHAQEIDLLVNWLFRLTNEYYNYKMASVIGIMVFLVCSAISLLAFNQMIKGDKEAAMQ